MMVGCKGFSQLIIRGTLKSCLHANMGLVSTEVLNDPAYEGINIYLFNK